MRWRSVAAWVMAVLIVTSSPALADRAGLYFPSDGPIQPTGVQSR